MCSFMFMGLFLTQFTPMSRVILTHNTATQYVQLREGNRGYVSATDRSIKTRPDLKNVREINGKIPFLCDEILAPDCRFIVESTNKKPYLVNYQWGDRSALLVIAKPLNLVVSQEVREIPAITIRESKSGHKLKPAVSISIRQSPIGSIVQVAGKDKQVPVEDVPSTANGDTLLDHVTLDELALFLEKRFRQPTVNLTSIEGTWSIWLSRKAAKTYPQEDKVIPLDELGLEMKWEKVKLLVTVIKDKPKGGQ
jgi:hypothetical protein